MRLLTKSDRYHVLGRGEGGIRRRFVAERDRHADIAAWAILPDFRRLRLRRRLEVDDRGQRLVIHGDKLGGVARLRFGLGDDEGNAVADAADAVGEENRTGGRIPFAVRPRNPA